MIHAHLRHGRLPLDPRPGDYVVVGDDEIEPALAEVLSRSESGKLRLRMLRRRLPHDQAHRAPRLYEVGGRAESDETEPRQ